MQDLALLFQLTPWLLWLSVALLGLLVGSFLNVVIYRLPIMMEREWKQECTVYFSDECKIAETRSETTKFNLLLPRSACPKCDHQITAL